MRRFRFLALSGPLWLVMLGSGCPSDSGDSMGGAADLASGADLTNPAAVLALSAVTPAVGPTTVGIGLTIDGQNFIAGATVTIAGIAATQVSVVSATRIMATLPAKPGAFGQAAVVVQNPDGQLGKRSDLFSYYASRFALPFANYPVDADPDAVVLGDVNDDLVRTSSPHMRFCHETRVPDPSRPV